jgi:hypothetical protein
MAFDSTPDYAWQLVQRIYAEVKAANGYSDTSIGSGEYDDLQNRIRNGQTIAQITSNTYDDARRRFPVNTRPNVEDTTTRDAQLNQGVQYQAPAQLIAQAVAAAPAAPQLVQAAAVGPGALNSDLTAGPGGPIGPRGVPGTASTAVRYTGQGGTFSVSGQGGGGLPFGLDMTTLLILAGVGVGAYLLLKKKRGA